MRFRAIGCRNGNRWPLPETVFTCKVTSCGDHCHLDEAVRSLSSAKKCSRIQLRKHSITLELSRRALPGPVLASFSVKRFCPLAGDPQLFLEDL